MGDAGAAVARSGSVVVAAVPTTRVVDGQTVAIRAVSATGAQIYQLRAHLCSAGSEVRTNFDFGFQGRRCANVALGMGSIEQTAEYGSGVNNAELNSFKVGVGDVRWVNELGFDQVLQCGPGHPCNLVVRAQITDDTIFFNFPLCYGGACPPEHAQPVTLVPTPTSTSTTVHPTTTTTTTNVAAAPSRGSSVGLPGGPGAPTPPARGTSTRAGAKARTAAGKVVPVSHVTDGAASPAPASRAAPKNDAPVDRSPSQTKRVLLAGLAGAIGSAWILSIFSRGSALLFPRLAHALRH